MIALTRIDFGEIREDISSIKVSMATIEEHLKNQNGKIFKNTDRLDCLEKTIYPINNWDKVKTIALTILSGGCGSMLTYILLKP